MIRESFTGVFTDSPNVRVPKDKVEEVARLFGEYLYLAGGSRGKSKHGSLGAVGKTLRRARTARGKALLGYARRVHEQLTNDHFPAGAAEKLDEGVMRLDDLLAFAAVGSHQSLASAVLEQVDYATYFEVKRRFVDFQRGWKHFAFQHQKDLGLAIATEDAAPWFSKKLSERKDGGDWIAAKEKYLATLRDRPADDNDTNEED